MIFRSDILQIESFDSMKDLVEDCCHKCHELTYSNVFQECEEYQIRVSTIHLLNKLSAIYEGFLNVKNQKFDVFFTCFQASTWISGISPVHTTINLGSKNNRSSFKFNNWRAVVGQLPRFRVVSQWRSENLLRKCFYLNRLLKYCFYTEFHFSNFNWNICSKNDRLKTIRKQ